MENINNIKCGKISPVALMSPRKKSYKVNFNDWIITPGCNIEITNDGTTLKVKKFNPKTYCIKADITKVIPMNKIEWEEFALPWYVSISNLTTTLSSLSTEVNDSGDTQYPGTHKIFPTGNSNANYYVKGFSLQPLNSDADRELFREYPWDMGVSGLSSYGDRPYKDWGWGGPTFGYTQDYSRIRVISNSSMTYNGNSLIPCIGIYGNFTNVDSDGFVDISNNPIEIKLLENTIEYDFHKNEVWKSYYGDTLIYNKEKTVDNCLLKYYSGYVTEENREEGINAGIKVIPEMTLEVDADYAIHKWPIATEIKDLNSYDITTLKLEQEAANSNTYVDWFSEKFNSYSNLESFYDLKLGGTKILNTESTPLIININRSTASDSTYRTLDGLFYAGISSYNTKINNLKIVLNYIEEDSWLVSTAQRMLYNFKGNVDIILKTSSGEEIAARNAFIPTQLDATFEGSNIKAIKREWLDLQRLNNIAWMCDWCSSLIEFQSSVDPQTITIKIVEGSYNNNCKWPEAIMLDTETEDYIRPFSAGWAQQAFCYCSNLTRIEPIIDVKYMHSVKQIYRMFYGCTSLTHLRLKGLNSFNWDFTSNDLQLDNLDAESVKYIFDNVEDLVTNKYDSNNIDEINDDPSIVGLDRLFTIPTGESFDYVNIRTKTSLNGLTIVIPQSWQDKGYITSEMLDSVSSKGWKVVLNGVTLTA